MKKTVDGTMGLSRWQNPMPAACVIFAVSIAAAIFSSRCLYADGAHEFVRVLQAQDFVVLMWSRHFAFYIYEFPLVLAIKLGVTNLGWLRFAFSLGCFLPWPLVMTACYWMSPKHFWLVVVSCAAGYLNTAYVAVSEHILAHAFFWPSLFAILFARPLKPLAAVILLASAAAMMFSYESQCILCLPLALLALWRAWQEKIEKSRWTWVIFLAASALFFAGVAIGLCAILMPEIPANFTGFKANTLNLLTHKGWTLTWTIVWACLALAVWLSEKTGRLLFHKGGICLLIAALIVWGTWPLLMPDQLDAARQYDNRILAMLIPMALLPVALILRFRPQWIESRSERLARLAAALLIAQSLWQISATWRWHQEVGRMQTILESYRGIVPLRSTVLAAGVMESREAQFDWTWPCLSISLAPHQKINCLICSEIYMDPMVRLHYWQPFDPYKPETLPNLAHYGMDFSGYVAALHELNVK
jgi:hypothetical protein